MTEPEATVFNPGTSTKRSRTTALLAQARAAQPTATAEQFVDEDTRAAGAQTSIARSGYGKIPVYKLTPTGCVRTAVSIQSLHEVLAQPHYSPQCFDCGSDECLYVTEIRGEQSTNQCEGKAPKKFRICPERTCRKRVYDPAPTGQHLKDEFDHSDRDDTDDPNVIGSDGDYGSTPEHRTKTLLDIHIVGFHPSLALELGLGRPPELPRLAVVA